MTKNLRQNLSILTTEGALKAFFIIFKEHLVSKSNVFALSTRAPLVPERRVDL